MGQSFAHRVVAGLIACALCLAPVGASAVAGTFDYPNDDFYTVFEDHALAVSVIDGVFANDLTSRGPCVYATDVAGLQGHLSLDSLGANGQFNFSPAIDYNGATTFGYTLGLVNGLGCDTTGHSATVTITVKKLNDPPAILLDTVCQNGVTVAEDSGPFADPGHCVEMVSFGPQDENNQSFDAWVVSTTHPELFAKKPTVTQVDGPFGRLSFTPAANANGTATVSVRGRDSGGTADGGVDTSEPEKFTIKITAVDDPTAVPTAAPTEAATPEPTAVAASVEPTASAAATVVPLESATPSPAASAVPVQASGDGLISLPIVLGALLVVLLGGFGAALLIPKWRADRGR